MQRLRLLTCASLAVLASCTPPDAALRVNVTIRTMGTSRVRADCLRLTLSNDTQELKSVTIKRPASDTAIFGVLRGSDLPATVRLQATGFLGTDCADDSTLKFNAQGASVTGIFPGSGVTAIDVFLDPPDASLDADRDGFVSAAKGGPDCNDMDATVFPGAGQVCSSNVDTDCNGLAGCDDPQCTTAVVCSDPADRVQVTTSIATMLRYECRGPFRVELRNLAGPRLAIRDTAVTLESSLAGVTVHGVASCNDMVLTTQTIPYGASFFEVYLQADGQAFGVTTLKATAAQVATPGTAMVEVHPQPIDHLEFTSPPRTVSAGQCSTQAVTLEFRDVMNRRTDVDSSTTITMASAPGDLGNANIFFSDAACATDGSMQQLQAGQGALSLQIKASRAGTFTLTATPSAGTGQTQPLTVSPAAPAQLAFTNGPLVLSTTQNCSAGQFTVQLQDQFANPATTATDLPIRLSVTGLSNVLLYDTATCTSAALTDFTIAAGTNSVSLRAAGMTASATPGEIRAAVLNGAPITDGAQVLRISAGFASKFQLTGNAQSPLASVCSANPFSVELLDSANNPASSASPVTFALTTLPGPDGTFHFYSGAGCQADLAGNLTVPAGQTSAQFYYRGNKAVATFEIRASSTLTAPGTFLPGNSIRAGPPAKLIFATPLAQTAQAGTCTPRPYVADVLDLFDNPTSFTTAQTVTVASNPAGVTVGPSTCSLGNTVPLAAGAPQVSFTAQHTVITPVTPYALTASVNGFSTATAATLTVTPGPSTLQVDTPAAGMSAPVVGACQQITLTRRDAFNNNAPTAGATPVTLGFPASTTWLVYASNNCMGASGASIAMNSTATVTFSVSPYTSGTQQMSASIGAGATLQTALVNFQVSPGAPTLVFETPATGTGSAAASQTVGGCTQVSVARKDSFGNDVPLGAAGNLTFTLPTGTTAYSANTCLPANAIANVSLGATVARGTFYVSATVSSPTGGPQAQTITAMLATLSATLTLTVSPGAPILSLVLPAGGMATLAANQCLTVTVERRDSFNNLVPEPLATTLSIAPAGLTLFSSTDCTTGSSVTLPVTAGASSRAFGVRTTVASAAVVYTITLDTQTVPMTLTVNPGPTTQFVVQGLPANAASAACIGPITLRRRDQWNNDTSSGVISVAMSSAQFQFSAAADCSGAAATLMVGIADLSAVSTPFYATAALAGTATMTATLGAATGTGSVTIGSGTPSQLVFTTPSRTFTAGICSGAANVITVQLRDAAGNPANAPGGGQAFTATSSSGGGTWYTNNTCGTSAAAGAFTILAGTNSVALYYKDTLAGSPSVSLTNGSSLTNPAAQGHTVTVGAAAKLVFTSLARTFTAAQCGALANAITVQLQDAPGNPVNAGGGGQAFTASSNSTGTVTWYTDDTCATAAPGGAFTIPSGSSSVSLVYKDTKVGTPSVSLANGSGLANPTAQVQTVLVGPPAQLVFTSAVQTIPALSCSAVATVTLQDLGGNTALTGSDRAIAFSATPAVANTTFYSDAACTTSLPSDTATMLTGSSTATMYFKADNANTITLTAASALLTSGTQTATVQAATPTKLVFTTAPMTVEAGFCQSLVVEREDALSRPTSPASATAVTLTALPSPGMLFFTNATCTTALAGTFPIATGASNATIYVKGVSGSLAGAIPGNQIYTHTAASGGLTSGTVDVTVEPMVRRRSVACTLATGTSTVTCAITPALTDITRTMLFFQATPNNGDTGSDDNVTCRLNLNTNAEVICDRAGTVGDVNVEWQTLSFAYSAAVAGGVSVQHLTAGCVGATTNAMPINVTTAAPQGSSFVLFSSRTPGSDNNDEYFFTAQLTTNTNLQFNQAANGSSTCTRTVDFAAQVVTWNGANVGWGTQAGGNATSFTAATTLGTNQGFVVYSSRQVTTDSGTNSNICRRRLRGEITSLTGLTFVRGCAGGGGDVQDISWEHVRTPAGVTVQQVTASTVSGQPSVVVAFTSVDLTRSVLFMGGQGQGGSASGKTDYSATARVGAALARGVMTSATAGTFTRSSSDLVGNFTGYVMQVTP